MVAGRLTGCLGADRVGRPSCTDRLPADAAEGEPPSRAASVRTRVEPGVPRAVAGGGNADDCGIGGGVDLMVVHRWSATMKTYGFLYGIGWAPWERYSHSAGASVARLLDREDDERDRPRRVLDLGSGRGQYAPELIRRGWDYVGVDNVARAIEAARRRRIPGATFVLGDVTRLHVEELGPFDLFLDVGCFQHLNQERAQLMGRGVTELAKPRATLLMLEFGLSGIGAVVGGTSEDRVRRAFPGWELVSVEQAETRGLGWPLSRTAPTWYRLTRVAG